MDEGARDTRTAADQLAIEQERASLALGAARMGEFEWEIIGDRFVVSERLAALTGMTAGDWPGQGGEAAYRNVHSDDVEALRLAVSTAIDGADRFDLDFRLVRPDDGRVLWLRGAAVVQRGEDGGARRLVGVAQDITERKADDEARNALVAELDHRVKNVLASVHSLAAQSARKTTSVNAFLTTFAGRLEAMASAHALLTATRWSGASLGDIAAAELGGLAQGQATWSGPELLLNPRATNALTLALHELATNAVKFGALSTDSGHVDVSWTSKAGDGFELRWVERGGPPVRRPRRHGFGSTLLERVTGRELGGVARAEFHPEGVRVLITADASAMAAGLTSAAPAAELPTRVAKEKTAGESSGALTPDVVRGRRILIVEDAVLLALELEAGLTEAGAQVVGAAANIEEALKLSEQPFDVAVLDANLNGTPVTPVAEALAALGKRFIFATGYGDNAPAPAGFDAPVVRKPYNVAQIAAAVAEALGPRPS
ncbi:MAG TPA: HWE histidine kinase domain-containing protein [Caulobacteraceae bacterium]|nr:HWE histidine kinase domain-containing protein [Caulobacteraceae bacterium]